MLNIAAQEYDSLQMISRLEPGTELYNFKVQQYKEMSSYRAELEKALQKQRMEKLKFDFSVQKKKATAAPVQDDTEADAIAGIEQAKRDTIVARLQQQYRELHKDKPNLPPTYNPSEGLTLSLDFVYNLPSDAAKLQIVYGIFANGITVLDLQQAGPTVTRLERDKAFCLMSFSQVIKDIPQIQEAQMIMEVQGLDRNGQQFNIGWTFIDLFDAANKLK